MRKPSDVELNVLLGDSTRTALTHELATEVLELRAELEAAKDALGRGWLADGASLAEGIRRKTAMLESLVHDEVGEDARHG